MTRAATATGVCSRHRGMPVVSRCVACHRELCSRCIVRTPVGFKCAACTGGEPTGAQTRRRVREPADPARPRRGARTALVLAATAALAVAAIVGYRISRPTTRQVITRGSAAGHATTPQDVPVQFTGAPGHQLSGDLLLPAASGGPVPAVLIVPDWGEVDRNGMRPAATLPDPLYADLAQALAAKGVASLRYDPAGQGQSALPQGSTLRFDDLVSDAGAGLHLMAGRVGIDSRRLSVVGHGWGGLVALQLSAEDRQVSRLVLVSTPGRPVLDSLADELRATAVTPADAQLEVQQLQQAAAQVAAGGPFPDPAALETALRPILPQGQEAYFKAIFALDPASLAQQVHVPAFIVRGGQDPALTAADSQRLAGAIGPAAQVLVADQAGRTLSVTTRTFAPGPTTVPTPNGGMQNLHVPNAVVTISRDSASLDAIGDWLLYG